MEPEPQAFWSLYTQELLENLASAASGLSHEEAQGCLKIPPHGGGDPGDLDDLGEGGQAAIFRWVKF